MSHKEGNDSETELIIFDGDDTLWRTQPLYDHAKDQFFERLVALGCPPDEVASRFQLVDVANVGRFGFGPKRLEMSMLDTARQCCPPLNEADFGRLQEDIRAIGESLRFAVAPTEIGAAALLGSLSVRYRLVLLTKGDEDIQNRQIDESRLRPFFDEVHIVDEKTTETFLRILAASHIEPFQAWSIGNSLRSDILPAAQLGMNVIWVQNPTWAWEDAFCRNDLTVPMVLDLLDIRNILPW